MGFVVTTPNFRSGRRNCFSSGQNLLQQRPIYQFASPDIGRHSSSMLLDDVGNCLPCTDETTDRSDS